MWLPFWMRVARREKVSAAEDQTRIASLNYILSFSVSAPGRVEGWHRWFTAQRLSLDAQLPCAQGQDRLLSQNARQHALLATETGLTDRSIDGSMNPSPPSGLVPVHTHLQLCIIIIIYYWICIKPQILVRSSLIAHTHTHIRTRSSHSFFFVCYRILN